MFDAIEVRATTRVIGKPYSGGEKKSSLYSFLSLIYSFCLYANKSVQFVLPIGKALSYIIIANVVASPTLTMYLKSIYANIVIA